MSKGQDGVTNDSASRSVSARKIVETILREGHLPKERQAIPPRLFKITPRPFITAQTGQTVLIVNDAEKIAELLLQRIKENTRSGEWAINVSDTEGNSEQWLQSELLTEDSVSSLTQTAMIFFINNLAEKLTEVLNEHIEESVMLTQRGHESLFLKGMMRDPEILRDSPDVHGKPSESVTKSIDLMIKRTSEAKRRRLLRPLMSIEQIGEPRWHEMKGHYDELLPIAQRAKRAYEHAETETWQAMIKAGYSQLDDDLIISLSNDTDDLDLLSENAAKATKDSESYSLPANIALEQAARRCGMKPFVLGPRRIRELMDKHDPLKSIN